MTSAHSTRLVLVVLLAGCGGPRRPHVPQQDQMAHVLFGDPEVHLPLLPDEARQIRRAVADELSLYGWQAVEESDLTRVVKWARKGIRVSDRAACGAPVPPTQLLSYVFADAHDGDIGVTCERRGGPCALFVYVGGRPGEKRRAVASYEAKIIGELSLAAILDASTRLTQAPPHHFDRLHGYEGASGRPDWTGVELGVRDMAGPWQDHQAVMAQIGTYEPSHCVQDRHAIALKDLLVVEVLADGTMGRCEPDKALSGPIPGQACICNALSKLRFAAGEQGRRYVTSVGHYVASSRSAAGDYIWASVELDWEASDRTVLMAGPNVSLGAVQACLEGVPFDAPDPLRLLVTWRLDLSGEPISAEIRDWPPTWGDERRACIAKALKDAHFACPQQGAYTVVTGQVRVGRVHDDQQPK